MEINVQAFELQLGNGISMSDLYDHLIASSSNVVEDRYLYVDRSGHHWRGLVLTSKNIKAFSRMQRESNGRVVLHPEMLTDSELAHFNYFLLDERTKRGLYQYYHGSATVNGLGSNLSRRYADLRLKKINEACAHISASSDNPPKAIKRAFSGSLSLALVLRRTSFESLLSELRLIKNATIEFIEYMPSLQAFQPLAARAYSVRHRLSFRGEQGCGIGGLLGGLVQSGNVKELSGIGIDQDNMERRFKLYNQPETLATYNFNDIVSTTSFDSSRVCESLTKAPMIDRLNEIGRQDPWFTGVI